VTSADARRYPAQIASVEMAVGVGGVSRGGGWWPFVVGPANTPMVIAGGGGGAAL